MVLSSSQGRKPGSQSAFSGGLFSKGLGQARKRRLRKRVKVVKNILMHLIHPIGDDMNIMMNCNNDILRLLIQERR